MASNDLAKPDINTEYTVKHTSNRRNRNIQKAGSMHENMEINDENLDEILQYSNLQLERAMQIISNGKTVKSNTVQGLKDFNSQTLTNQAKKEEQLVSMIPAI